MITVLFKAGL